MKHKLINFEWIVNNLISRMAQWNLFDVVNSAILKFPAVLEFPAIDL